MIRKAVFQDEEQIAVVYEKARAYMAEHGNPNQWGRTFPPRELTHEDIEKGILYVLEEQGEVHGAFMFEIGEDPTYQVISEGAWKSDAPYGVIHRVASDGKVHGLMKETVAFCTEPPRAARGPSSYDGARYRARHHRAVGCPHDHVLHVLLGRDSVP